MINWKPFLAVVAAATLSFTAPASAQSGAAGSVDVEKVAPRTVGQGRSTRSIFSVKFLCGTIFASAANTEFPAKGANELLAPGTYLTVANIINTDATGARNFNKRFVSGINQSETEGLFIGPHEEQTVDCLDFLSALGGQGSLETEFFLGHLLLEAFGRTPLEVTGIYTFKNVEGQNVGQPLGEN